MDAFAVQKINSTYINSRHAAPLFKIVFLCPTSLFYSTKQQGLHPLSNAVHDQMGRVHNPALRWRHTSPSIEMLDVHFRSARKYGLQIRQAIVSMGSWTADSPPVLEAKGGLPIPHRKKKPLCDMIHRARRVIYVGSVEGEEVLDSHNTGLSRRTFLQGVGNVEHAQTVE